MRNVLLPALACALCLAAAPLRAQEPSDWDARGEQLSRATLLELLERLEQTANSPAYSEELRRQAADQMTLIRARLEEGDFQVGDRIMLQVEGEEALTDTFTVQSGRTLTLPDIGEIPLSGVLRAELDPHLQTYLARFIREPRARARSMIRVAITGAVDNPGFYTVPAEALLTDLLMAAGGPASEAKITEIHVERGDRRIWEGEPLQEAIIQGRTLDELNLRAGDRVVVPGGTQAGRGGAESTLRTVGLILALPLSIAGLITILR